MNKVLSALLFLTLLFILPLFFPTSIYAGCGTWDYTPPETCQGEPSGSLCLDGVRCCFPASDCNTLSGGLYGSLATYTGFYTFGAIVVALVPYIFAIAGILLLIYLIYGGISLMTAQGDPKKVMAAHEMITGALIGFIIVFTSFWIVQIVGRVLNIPALINIFG